MRRAPWRPRKVVDVELGEAIAGLEPLADITQLDGYSAVWGLVRLHGTPVGTIEVPVVDGKCPAVSIGRAVLAQHADRIIRHFVLLSLGAQMPPEGWDPARLFALRPPPPPEAAPSLTVAVCTRDRPAELARCLDALLASRSPGFELLVVDNAPATDAVRVMLEARFPRVRYAREPRPGLDWARNRAIAEAAGEILAFTDDDGVADPGWTGAVQRVFAEQPDVMAVTGPVVPLEIETEAQKLFEVYGGFGRGFERRWCRAQGDHRGRAVGHHRPAQFGTGANMAFRREIFSRIGGFDPALDVGTATGGGGDLEMFFRVIQEGYTLAYEPDAIIRHRHRADSAALERQIAGWGTAFFAYAARSWTAYPRERLAFTAVGARWLGRWVVRRGAASLLSPKRHPWQLALAELRGAVNGPIAWRRSQRAAAEIAERFGPQGLDRAGAFRAEAPRSPGAGGGAEAGPCLAESREVLVDRLGTALLDPHQPSDGERQWRALYGALAQRLAPGQDAPADKPGKFGALRARNLLPWPPGTHQ